MEQIEPEKQHTRGGRMKKYVMIIAIVVAVIGVAAVATYALLTVIAPKNTTVEQPNSPAKLKARATAAATDAKKLLDEAAKLGNGKESDKKTEQAIAKFNEASKLYEQAGDKNASLEAKANADMLANRLAAEAGYKAKLEAEREAERARQKAEQDAAKSSGNL